MWFQGTTDYCTIHLDNFWEGLENEIASNHTSQAVKVIYQTLQQITQLKDAMVSGRAEFLMLEEKGAQRRTRHGTDEASRGTFGICHIYWCFKSFSI